MKKTCFIITPIGDENSSTRKRVDQWNTLVYEPALGDEFKLIRADQISASGIITEQILEQIVHANLAIIDYTELNPNVMYEAALRHISNKPFIQIYPIKTRLPFDISNLRAICYDPEDLQHPTKLCNQIKEAYKEVQSPKYKVPELLPLKFNLEKIFSDPVKFVELLKQHLPLTPTNNDYVSYQQNITEVYDDPLKAYLGTNQNRVKCPKCGIIQNMLTIQYMATVTVTPKHYRCNNCGTEFEK